MKKLVISILVLFFICGLSHAQIEKGSVFLGTSTTLVGGSSDFITGTNNSIGISFASVKWDGSDEKEKSTVLNFSPKMGYFVANNLVVGANVKLWSQKADDSKSSINGIGPFVRYYFTDGKIVPFVETELTFGKYKETWDSSYSDGESIQNITMASLGAGAAFFLNKHISIDCLLGYKTLRLKDNESSENGKITFNNIGLVIGFTATF